MIPISKVNNNSKSVMLLSLPFAGTAIPSIQLGILESVLKEKNIKVDSKHLYLKAAEIIGLNNYNFLIYNPNDSYTAQMVFSKYVFPDHWEKNKEKFEKYFNERLSLNKEISKTFSFKKYIDRIDKFYNYVIKNINWKEYDIIGFSLNYGQFLPSLAISKKIKELYPEKIIIFGGSRTTGELGKKVLKYFDYIDFIVSGEGEEALASLALNFEKYKKIPRLIYREKNEIIWNKTDKIIDLNNTPIPKYNSFFRDLKDSSKEIQQYFTFFGRLPIENSRGCWWNKCTFCNMNLQHNKYREKDIDKIIFEIEFLSKKYEMLNFQMLGNTLPKKNLNLLLKKIIKINKNFHFFSEARADQLKSNDYKLLKKAGFTTLQIGIEAFSKSYLKKINKGVKVIDNIAALKFCKEKRITLRYNMIINFPNEELVDFEETKENIDKIKHYLDGPQISYLTVGYGSPIYQNYKKFNIEQLEYTNIDKIMFPQEILEKGFNYLFNYKKSKEYENIKNDWESIIKEWNETREKFKKEEKGTHTVLDRLVFYYVDGLTFVKIYDKRDKKRIKIYTLNGLERKIFLACLDVMNISRLKEEFSKIKNEKIKKILNKFEEKGIIFRDENHYLSLPLKYEDAL